MSVVLIGVALLLFFVPPAKRAAWARWVPLAAGAALLLQLLVEGRRWQMDPAYPVAAGLLIATWLGPRTSWHHAITVVIALLGTLGLAWTCLLAQGVPMFELPEPTGPHAVGITRLYVADPEREETFTLDPDDHRELMVTVWYPAAAVPDGQEPAFYWEETDESGPLMARLMREGLGVGVLDNGFDHYGDIPTHSYRDAPLVTAPAKLPVIVYSHGYGVASPSSNTALMEHLASHGYVVASIAHTYETPAVVFEDGRVVGWNEEAIQDLFSSQNEAFFEKYVATEDPAARDAQVRDYLAAETRTTSSLAVWLADTRTVVDEIFRIAAGEGGERDTPFAGRLDLDRLGVAGMSFGGATAGAFCVADRRCKAGLNLDGFHYGEGMADAVVPVPFFIFAARRAEIPINDFFYRHASGPMYLAKVDGATHMDFTDTTIASNLLRWMGAMGPIDGERMLEIMNVWVEAFFDRYLLGEPSPLLEGDSADWPDVELTSRNTDA